MEGERLDRLRRHGLWLSRLTLFLFCAAALTIVLPTAIGLVSREQAQPLAPRILFVIVMWLPAVFYLYALWAIGGSFGAFARGGMFGAAMAKGCRRAGVALAIGATTSAVIVPNLMRFLAQRGMISDPARRFTSLLVFDVAYLAVGVVGIALFLLGGLIDRAAEVQQEARALRAELGEFF